MVHCLFLCIQGLDLVGNLLGQTLLQGNFPRSLRQYTDKTGLTRECYNLGIQEVNTKTETVVLIVYQESLASSLFACLYMHKPQLEVTNRIDHFTVVCSVTWPLDGSEARVDFVLIQTSLLLLCKTSSDAN